MRHRIGALIVAAATGLMWIAVAGGPATAEPTTQTFSATGDVQSFVVPEGVCSVSVTADGAQGGANSATNSLGGSIPGLGGEAQATVPVTPGETLVVVVGTQGAPGSTAAVPATVDSAVAATVATRPARSAPTPAAAAVGPRPWCGAPIRS